VDPGAGLDDVEKTKFFTVPGLELRPLGRPARSQSPSRLRYPSSAEGLGQLKNPMTSSGIKPATFRFVFAYEYIWQTDSGFTG
jgi:hypothetical protein